MTFRITGPGDYTTRDGRKAVVLGEIPIIGTCRAAYPWVGYMEQLEYAWKDSGQNPRGKDVDIISTWREPVVVEGWLSVRKTGIYSYSCKIAALNEDQGACRKIRWDGSKIVDVTGVGE